MTLELQPKPPLGSRPFHIMEMEREACGLCGMTKQEIVAADQPFCPTISAANKAASVAWQRVIIPIAKGDER